MSSETILKGRVLSFTGSPFTLTRLAAVSTRSGPQTISAEEWPAARRIKARSLASSSSM